MPFEAPFEQVDIDRGRTQMSPLLVSSRGRYIWSPEPFSITFTGESFVIESPLGEIKAVSAGRTLRRPIWSAAIATFHRMGIILLRI